MLQQMNFKVTKRYNIVIYLNTKLSFCNNMIYISKTIRDQYMLLRVWNLTFVNSVGIS